MVRNHGGFPSALDVRVVMSVFVLRVLSCRSYERRFVRLFFSGQCITMIDDGGRRRRCTCEQLPFSCQIWGATQYEYYDASTKHDITSVPHGPGRTADRIRRSAIVQLRS
jgi:hypothetical protein